MEGGHLISLMRNDEAEPGLVELAIARAYAAEDWPSMSGASGIAYFNSRQYP